MKIVIRIYILLSILICANVLLYVTNRISISGILTEKIIFWAWFMLTFVVVLKNLDKKTGRVYGLVLIIIFILTLLPMMVPFNRIIIFLKAENNSFEIDNKYRVIEKKTPLYGMSYFVIVENIGLFEKEKCQLVLPADMDNSGDFDHISQIKSINLNLESAEFKMDFKNKKVSGKIDCTKQFL